MARTRNLRLLGLAVLAVCLLGATGGRVAGPPEVGAGGAAATSVAVLSPTATAALLPARAGDAVRSPGTAVDTRVLVAAGILATLLGLAAVRRQTVSPAEGRGGPLRNRRHSIALRAPPLQFA